jgi:RHS repeat-associated protein
MWTWFSDPFGTDAANSNPAGAGPFAYNLRLPGQVFDGQVGLHSNGYRDFDPATGRYIESDLIGLRGGINTYTYVGGNAISRIDPLGLMPPPVVPPTIGQSAAQQNANFAQNIYNPQQFYDIVKNGGAWDYKQYDRSYQDFGNYNFGVTAAATGLFNLRTILQQAGRAQCEAHTSSPKWGRPDLGPPYGDDPNDQYWITEGWNDYQSGMYGPPQAPRAFGLAPAAADYYSNHIQQPLPYCSSRTQCW